MADNMTIGPALAIGGNKVEMTQQGKIQVTNPNGKIKTLSQDQFKKQLVKNADKIQNGEDFEFKKDKKTLKIAAAVVIYRKEIGKYMKDFSFKKLWNDIKGLFKSKNSKGVKDATNAVAGDTEAKAALDAKRHATYSKTEAANEAHRYHAKNAETINLTEAETKAGIADAEAAFKGYDPLKFKKGQVLENAGLTQEQYKIVKRHANPEKVVSSQIKKKQYFQNGFKIVKLAKDMQIQLKLNLLKLMKCSQKLFRLKNKNNTILHIR